MVKNFSNGAIGYVRISIKDQSYYSIEYQRKAIIDYCLRNSLNLLAVFTDDGQSSYTFDRPNWLSLEEFIQQHKSEVRYVIILDHDRFSRNLPDALKKMDELETKFGVKVLSIAEPITINSNSPETFLTRSFKLLLANNELLKIRERTRRGIIGALESGRFVNKAPFGYKNARDEGDRPIIIIDPVRGAIVQRMFDEFLMGIPPKKIVSFARRTGFSLKGKSALTRVLTNPVYAGLIKVPEYDGIPEKIVKGLHAPLVSEPIYWRANELLSVKTKCKGIPKEDLPLRGILQCSCGASFTGAFSKGRSKHYLYYRCSQEGAPSYPADKVHELFDGILKRISLSEDARQNIKHCAQELIVKRRLSETFIVECNMREISDIDRKMERLEEYLLNGLVEPGVYKKWSHKLRDQRTVLKKQIHHLQRQGISIQGRFDKMFSSFKNIRDICDELDHITKQALIRKIFEAGLVFNGKLFKTSFMYPTLLSSYKTLEAEGMLVLDPSFSERNKNASRMNRITMKIESGMLTSPDQQLYETIAALMIEHAVGRSSTT